jgi:hypothetical protein
MGDSSVISESVTTALLQEHDELVQLIIHEESSPGSSISCCWGRTVHSWARCIRSVCSIVNSK